MAGNRLPWHKRRHRDWLCSELRSSMNLAERGLYTELLDRHYAEGSIPNDETTLARLTGVSLSEFRRAWQRVREEFEPAPNQPGRLIQAEAAAEFDVMNRYVDQQVEKGRLGGRPKKATEKLRLNHGKAVASQRVSSGKADVKLRKSHKDKDIDIELGKKEHPPLTPPLPPLFA